VFGCLTGPHRAVATATLSGQCYRKVVLGLFLAAGCGGADEPAPMPMPDADHVCHFVNPLDYPPAVLAACTVFVTAGADAGAGER